MQRFLLVLARSPHLACTNWTIPSLKKHCLILRCNTVRCSITVRYSYFKYRTVHQLRNTVHTVRYCHQSHLSCQPYGIPNKPYGIPYFKYRTVFRRVTLRYFVTKPYGTWLTTVRYYYFKLNRTGHGWLPYGITISNSVRCFNSDRDNLHRYVPYGTHFC